MKIPKTLKICGHTYKVEMRKEPLVDNELVFGCCYQRKQLIVLQEDMSEDRAREVILHECIHAIDDELRLGMGENVVNLLGIMLKDLIVNNKLDLLS